MMAEMVLGDREVSLNVLFDLDGTLTDPAQGIIACIEHALSELREPVPPRTNLARCIGPPLRDTFCELLSTSPDDDRIERAVTAYRNRFESRGIFENVVYEGIPGALEQLAVRNAHLYVATSKPHVYARRILEHFGLAKYFRGVFGSELDGTRSNKGELIGFLLSALGLRVEQTVMVGDRRHDIAGALQHHVFPVGVLWGYGSRDELADAGAKLLVHEPSALAQLAA